MTAKRLAAILALAFAVFATVAQAAVDREALRKRIEDSVRARSGGSRAREALCQFDAVLDFYDGQQTPELIPDWLAWQQFVLTKDSAADFIQRSEVVAAGTKRLIDHLHEFERASIQVFQAYEQGKSDLSARGRVSNRFANESERMAMEMWKDFEKRLTPDEFSKMRERIREEARKLVILRWDHERWQFENRCD